MEVNPNDRHLLADGVLEVIGDIERGDVALDDAAMAYGYMRGGLLRARLTLERVSRAKLSPAEVDQVDAKHLRLLRSIAHLDAAWSIRLAELDHGGDDPARTVARHLRRVK